MLKAGLPQSRIDRDAWLANSINPNYTLHSLLEQQRPRTDHAPHLPLELFSSSWLIWRYHRLSINQLWRTLWLEQLTRLRVSVEFDWSSLVMRSRSSLTFSAGDLVFERPKKFMIYDQGAMRGGVLNAKKQFEVELKDVGGMGDWLDLKFMDIWKRVPGNYRPTQLLRYDADYRYWCVR